MEKKLVLYDILTYFLHNCENYQQIFKWNFSNVEMSKKIFLQTVCTRETINSHPLN